MAAANTSDAGWWLSLLSDATKYGASLWERYFGAGTPATPSGVEVMSSGGKTTITVGKMPWVLIGGGVLLLIVACGFMKKRR